MYSNLPPTRIISECFVTLMTTPRKGDWPTKRAQVCIWCYTNRPSQVARICDKNYYFPSVLEYKLFSWVLEYDRRLVPFEITKRLFLTIPNALYHLVFSRLLFPNVNLLSFLSRLASSTSFSLLMPTGIIQCHEKLPDASYILTSFTNLYQLIQIVIFITVVIYKVVSWYSNILSCSSPSRDVMMKLKMDITIWNATVTLDQINLVILYIITIKCLKSKRFTTLTYS